MVQSEIHSGEGSNGSSTHLGRDEYYAEPGSEEEYLPEFRDCGLIPVSDFRKHPLSRSNPWARPHPDSVRRRATFELEDPYTELEERGAKFNGEKVIVHEAHPSEAVLEGCETPPPFEGEAVIQESPFETPTLVNIEDLDPIPRFEHTRTFAKRIPKYYEREIQEKEEIADATPIDVYCSSVNPRWGWRWKIISYYEANRPAVRDSCETLIVDSGFNRWGSPEDVLEAAAKMDADYVFATDVTGMEDPSNKGHNPDMPTVEDDGIDSQFEAAVEGIERFMDRARDLEILDKTILPIQHPYLDFLEVAEEKGWLDEVRYIALGSLKRVESVDRRIEMLHAVRKYVGDDMKIHALAPGTEPELLKELRDNPNLIDSLDNSTPEKAPASNKIPDASWTQNKHLLPFGDDISTVRAQYSGSIAVQFAYMISPLCSDRTFDEVIEPKTDSESECIKTIDEWAAT
ncbi:hypothetical protein [Halorhabdus rudnickae]|uniref:hypothetical protein n=1 Tax=Halorhabdus rudnickae TaxID=1775544 RepID=UPI0010848296|nr:hypothetical protein [Halorhabdus rudnickae]